MVKVAVLGSASAPLAVMTAPTADRAMVMIAMVTSRLPIEPPFLGRTPVSGSLSTETAVAAGWLQSCPTRPARPGTPPGNPAAAAVPREEPQAGRQDSPAP